MEDAVKKIRSQRMKEMNAEIKALKEGGGRKKSTNSNSAPKKRTVIKKKKSPENQGENKKSTIETERLAPAVAFTQRCGDPVWNKIAVKKWVAASCYRTVYEGDGHRYRYEARGIDGEISNDSLREHWSSNGVCGEEGTGTSSPLGADRTDSTLHTRSDRNTVSRRKPGSSDRGDKLAAGRKRSHGLEDEEDAARRVIYVTPRRRRHAKNHHSTHSALSVGSHVVSEVGQYNPAYVDYWINCPFNTQGTLKETITFELVRNPFASLDYINTLYYNQNLVKTVKVPRVELLRYSLQVPDMWAAWMLSKLPATMTVNTEGYVFYGSAGWAGNLYFHNLTSPQNNLDKPFADTYVLDPIYPPGLYIPGQNPPKTSTTVVSWPNHLQGKVCPNVFDANKNGAYYVNQYKLRETSTLDDFNFNHVTAYCYPPKAAASSETATNVQGTATNLCLPEMGVCQRDIDFTDGSGRGIMLGSNKIHFSAVSSDGLFEENDSAYKRTYQMHIKFWIRVHWENLQEQTVIDAWNSQNSTATSNDEVYQ